ncbi:MAG: hypothetical protein AAFV43_07805 [Planctomycetota bacterium]
MHRLPSFAVAIAALLATAAAEAVVVPSVYNNSIFAFFTEDPVNDPAVATAFDDWDSVPVAFTDAVDNPGFADFNEVKLANDENFLYVYVSYHGNDSINTYLSFDTDQDVSTGFDIFGFGLVGAESSYVNDFAFSQKNGGFNEGGLTGGPFGNGGAPIWPFFNADGPEREWMIPLDTTHDAAGTDPVFTQDTINILLWHEAGNGDLLDTAGTFDVLTYTLADAPVVEGDYNGDSAVDLADYTVWRDSFGDIGVDLPADGNGDEIVNEADYTYWVDAFNGTLPSAGQAVPEPAAALLAVAALPVLWRRR